MSQYSETIGSFIRTGNYPLEANYIFESEEALKQFYSDPVAATTLHEGLFKIVKTGANDKQALYWVVNGENGLEFKVVLEDLQLEDIETQIDNILQKIEDIYGTSDPSEIPEELNSILELANTIKELQTKLSDIKEELKAAVGTDQDDIKTYLQTLAYKSITELSGALHTFLQTSDPDNTAINTWPELQNFLSGYNDTQVLKEILDNLVNDILGNPTPTEAFRTLRGIEDFIRALQSTLSNQIANLQKELNTTQEGVGLDQSGNYAPDLQTNYLKEATSVMQALRTLDGLMFKLLNRGSVYTIKGSVVNLEALKAIEFVEKGDVYNVETAVTINEVDYPAHNNFVYIGDEPNQALIESNWDSLGGMTLDNGVADAYFQKGKLVIVLSNGDTVEVEIPNATSSSSGLLSSEDKLFIDGIRGGNLALPTPIITGTWTFYKSDDSVVNSSEITPTPNATNPQLEQGYKASFSGTYKWTHEDGKKDPTQVQSGSNWSDLPSSGVNSSTYTSLHVTSNTTIKIGIQAAKTGLMVSGTNVVPATGMDTAVAQRSVSFTTRRFWGVTTEATITESVIKTLNNELGGKAVTKTNITATPSQYFVYAYPKSLGALSTIIQDGATPVLGAFTRSELTITNAAGASVDLYVYRANNLGAFTNAQLQFS